MDEKELIARVDESTKSAHKRIDKIEDTIDSIHELAFSVKEIATEIKLMRNDVNSLDDRVGRIEKEPLNNYKETKKQIRNASISVIIGTVIGSILTLILK